MGYREKIYDTYSSISGLNRPLKTKYQVLAHNLIPLLQTVPQHSKILDIGSGQGEFLELCCYLGLDAEGIDVSYELVDACVSRGLKVSLVSDLYDFLKACSNEWSLVNMIDILEHFTKTEAFDILKLIHSYVLYPGGKIILQVPNMQSPFATLNLYHDLTH